MKSRLLLTVIVFVSCAAGAKDLSEEIVESLYSELYVKNDSCETSSAIHALSPEEIIDGINCLVAISEIEGKEWGYIIMRETSSTIPLSNNVREVTAVDTKYENIWLFSYVEK